jgi:hypothetical protein
VSSSLITPCGQVIASVGLFHAAVMLMLVSRRFTALGASVEEAL